MRPASLSREEQLRNADAVEYRHNFGYFALVPVSLAAGIQLGHSLLGKSHPGVLWLILGAVGTVFYFGSFLWARLVPAAVSVILGLVGWTVLLRLTLHSH